MQYGSELEFAVDTTRAATPALHVTLLDYIRNEVTEFYQANNQFTPRPGLSKVVYKGRRTP